MVTVKDFSKLGYCSIGLSHRVCRKSLKLIYSSDSHFINASFFNKFDSGFALAEESLMNLLKYPWKPLAKSKIEKHCAVPKWPKISETLGNGHASPILFSFKSRKSITIFHFFFPVASIFLGIISKGEL